MTEKIERLEKSFKDLIDLGDQKNGHKIILFRHSDKITQIDAND